MAKRKRRSVFLRRCRLIKKRKDNMDKTKDPPLTRHTGIDSNSEMIKPNTKDVTDIDEASTQLAIDTTKINNCPASDDSDISIGELLQRVDARIAKIEAEKNQTRITEDKLRKTPVKSEPIAVNDSSECKNKDIPSATEVQTDSVANISEPKVRRRGRPRVRPKKTVIISEKIVVDDSPTCETGMICVDSCVEVDSISEKATPIKKRIRKPRSEQLQSPSTSVAIEVNNKPACKTEDVALVTGIQSDLITEISEPDNKLTCKAEGSPPKKLITSVPMKINISPGSENKDTSSATEVQTDSILEITKPKPKVKRTRKSRVKELKVEVKPDVPETTCNLVNETKDTPPENENVSKLITTSEIQTIQKRPRGRPRKNLKTLEKNEVNNNLVKAAEDSIQTDAVSETPEAENNQIYNSEETSQGAQPGTDSNLVDAARTIDDHVAETKNLSPENHNLSCSSPKTVQNKCPLIDKIYQPKVLLWNIAHSDQLKPKQREMLLKEKQSERDLSLEIVTDSSINQSIEELMPHDVIIPSSEFVKENHESVESISGTRGCEHSNTRKHSVRKRKGIKTQVKVFPTEKRNEVHTSKLSVHSPGTNSQSTSGTDVVSSVGNEESGIEHRCSPSIGLSLEKGSLTITRHNNLENKLKESISPPEEEISMCSLSDIIESDIPLDLSIRNSEKSTSNTSDFFKPGVNYIGDTCSETKKCQLPDTNVQNVGFGSSTFHLTNLSTSFIEIENGLDVAVTETVSKPSKKIDTCDSRTLQKYKLKDEKPTIRHSNKAQSAKLPISATASKRANKQPIENPAKLPISSTASKRAKKRPLENPAKLPISSTASKRAKKRPLETPAKPPSRDTLSLKVSIPAKHYFNKRRLTREKLETVIEKKEPASAKVQTISHADDELNETDHQESKNVTHSITVQKPSEVNVVTTEPQTSKEEEDRLPTPLPDMCLLDDTDTDFQTAFEKPASSGPTISNVRSLPKIVVDEILPKGTIKLSSLNCRPSTSYVTTTKIENDRSYSMNVSEIVESHNIRELTIHTQSTYTSIVNQSLSESQITTHCWNQAHASNDMDNINASSDTVEYFQEFRNPQGIGSKRFSENIKSDGDNQNYLVVEKTFDSTQLWKICPELESYFSSDDVINNNSEDRSSDSKALETVKTNCNNNNEDRSSDLKALETMKTNCNNNNEDRSSDLKALETVKTNCNNNNEDRSSDLKALETVKTNYINNTVHTVLTDTKIDTEENLHDSTDLPSDIDNVRQLNENTNNSPDVLDGVVAVNVNPSGMDVESSESATTNIYELNSKKCSVITNLTAANLRNFNNISNYHGKSGLKWSTETCQYYSSHSNYKPMPDSVFESSCGATEESTLGSQGDFPPAKSRKRKRKWIENEKNDKLRPEVREKRLKLNRNKWSIERQDFKTTINSPKPNLAESVSSDNFGILNVESTQSPKKISREDLEGKITIENKLNIVAEESLSNRIRIRKPEELDEKMINYTPTNKEQNMNTSTSDPGTSKCDFGTDNRLLSGLHITLPKNFKNNYSKNEIDRNGNFKSNSSSSSSSSQSSGSSSDSRRSSPSNASEENNPVQNVREPEPHNTECINNEKIEEEADGDCISLFAESLFTNIDQGANGNSLSPLFDGMKDSDDKRLSPLLNDVKNTDAKRLPTLFDGVKDSDDKFQDMTDIGTYFDKNVEECNAAYESCVQEDDNTLNTSHILPNSPTNEHHDKIIPQLMDPEIHLNQRNLSQPMRSFGTVPPYPQATILQESPLIDIAYLKERLVKKKGTAFSTYVGNLFDWHCFTKLRRGVCNREMCPFSHGLGPGLQNLEERDPELIHEVFEFAMSKCFDYFTQSVYPQVIMRMDYPNIILLFYNLISRNLLNTDLARCTIAAVTTAGISTRAFMTDMAHLLDGKNDGVADYILRVVDGIIEFGDYWNTCRALLIRSKPSNLVINRVISECIYSGEKLQIEDVYSNYVRSLTAEQELRINPNLRRQFHILLVAKNLIRKIEHPPAKFENVDSDDRMLKVNDVPESYHKESIEIPTILSPDDAVHWNYENSSQFSPRHKQQSQKFNPQESSSDVLQSLTKNQAAGSDSAAGCSHSFFRRWRNPETLVGYGVKQESPDSNIKTLECGGANSFTRPYKLYPIDDLPPPRSAFRDRHWKYHLDMNNLKEALKHKEYSLALKVLNEYSDVDQTIFTSSCYKMLRQNVMASAHHVRNMIKLSVRMGVNNFVSETLFTFGMYTMIELCNANAWVLAYSLHKSLKSANLTERVAAYALLSAEICLANGRPLKAFIILKQNNMFCTNRSEWNVVSNPIDEDIRVMIIKLLLDVLCQKYPDWAFYIFTYLVQDQPRIYHPIDLTAYVDKLVTGILTANSNDLISDLGRLIIENNFTLENTVFQSLVVSIFQTDKALCRQLYHYGTWLGVYSLVTLTLPLHILIKTNWTKEEMYLVVMDFLEKLSMDIGPAADHIGPNQFAIHLVFELAPFKEQMVDNNVEICNKDELKMSKELMKTVLQKLFTPPLRTIIAEKERFMKLQSRSVVNYLKSMMV